MKYSDLTEKIIKAAYTVHNVLGCGFLEKVYQNALVIELQKMGLKALKEKPITIYYEDKMVGEYIADVIVEDKVILELKAVKESTEMHEVQLENYLKATGIEVGLLINFSHSVQAKRKVFDQIKF